MKTLLNATYSRYHQEDRRVDVFLPEEPRKNTCLLFIHGGGFNAGTKESWHSVAAWFCEQGYVCAAMTYRLAPGEAAGANSFDELEKRLFPAQVEDARLCMDWLKARADLYGFSKDRIVAIGSSAGGYLCAMLMTIHKEFLGYTHEMQSLDTVPMATVLYCPAIELDYTDTTMYGHPITSIENLMGKPYQGNETLYQLASPLHRIIGNECPCLLIHGTADKLITEKAIRAFAGILEKHRVPVETVWIEGAGHGFGYGVKTRAQQEAAKAALAFIRNLQQ